MAKQFLHISFIFKDQPYLESLEPVFGKALDWLRYSDTCWIVYTSSDADKWYRRLKPEIGEKDNILIIKADPSERQGYMPKTVWDWFKKPRDD